MSVVIKHNAGFFSCCSMRLDAIVKYINRNKKLPIKVDSSNSYGLYKEKKEDVTFHFFEDYNNTKSPIINTRKKINYRHSHQYKSYVKLDYRNIVPLVNKYFCPSQKVQHVKKILEEKYNIEYNKCIGVYYRSTDKIIETNLSSFDGIYAKIKILLNNNPNYKILIQTDSSKFLDYIRQKKINNIIVIEENTTSYTNKGIHNENSASKNYEDMFNLFATFLIISKCKYVICGISNGSLWIMLYRGNGNNIYQYNNGKWLHG